MEEYSDKKVKLSDINEGFLQLQRLHNIWVKCHYYLTKGEYKMYNWNLDSAWIELYPDAYDLDQHIKLEDKKYVYRLNEINKNILKTKDKDMLYKYLKDKHMLLKLLQEKAGKGSKKSDYFQEDSLMVG